MLACNAWGPLDFPPTTILNQLMPLQFTKKPNACAPIRVPDLRALCEPSAASAV
jgi:hypothetical protein